MYSMSTKVTPVLKIFIIFEDTKGMTRIRKSRGQAKQWPKENGQPTMYKTHT